MKRGHRRSPWIDGEKQLVTGLVFGEGVRVGYRMRDHKVEWTDRCRQRTGSGMMSHSR